jgi:hypothetical protein
MRKIWNNVRAGMANPRIEGLAILFLLGTIVLSSFTLESAPKNLPLCAFHAITGLPCPSCGMTRAFISLAHGDIHSAFLLNPASMIIYLAAWAGLILALLQVVFKRKYIEMIWNKGKRVLFPIILFIMAITWIYKLTSHFAA